jgi:predicted ATPase
VKPLLFLLLWQTSRHLCQAAQLLPQLQECLSLLHLLAGGDLITIPRETYRQLLADARALALLQSEIAPAVDSLNHSSDILESNFIH